MLTSLQPAPRLRAKKFLFSSNQKPQLEQCAAICVEALDIRKSLHIERKRSEADLRSKKDNQWVKDILEDPDIILVIAALSFVNLKDNEIDVLKRRFLDGKTQNETAEILEIDVRTVQRREYEALRKCEIVWKNNSFVKFILQKQKENSP